MMTTREQEQGTRRGRRAIHQQVLTPDGLTQEQRGIMRDLAREAGISVAEFKRQMASDFLEQFGYSKEEQGLTRNG